jgi:hypothetical protein
MRSAVETESAVRKCSLAVIGEVSALASRNQVNYKQAHLDNFDQLNQDSDFVDLFDDVEPIKKYVGRDKIQLRRAAAIQEKGYYRNSDFIKSLIANKDRLKLNISVDGNNRIVVAEDACRDIFQALLDHRLISHFQENVYDVQHTVDVP